ncbi:helix-turn-helix domain-containing protein [Marininema halotolerans]|uniref:Helix-turn-helix domain-containing protein n=1 Tax=Marininema halotolerans TaxID=1155944 RepID=A0A1I6Q4L6_9BACL|nr:helix-turn-helix domain-containing protein [Marininema halotolerans]SFS47416.1 Helix-turn-helix domain-containing protein [Marininema halotolerans]
MSERIFVKLYIDAVHAGMVADMGADNWHTLCVLASFIDKDGTCYPSQEYLADRMGVKTREAANRRIKALCEYRWEGRTVVTKEKVRGKGQMFANNKYYFTEVSPFAIR